MVRVSTGHLGAIFACLGTASLAVNVSAAPIDFLATGDSITEGAGSTLTGGYRMFLDDILTENGVAHTWTGGRYSNGPNASDRGRYVNGQAFTEIAGVYDLSQYNAGNTSVDATFESWQRHYGIGGISANRHVSSYNGGDYRRETYSGTRSLMDRYVNAAAFDSTASHATNLATIRDSSINGGLGDFAPTVFGTASGGGVQAPNTVMTLVGTNSLGNTGAANTVGSFGSVNDAADQLNDLLNAYELLQHESYFQSDTQFLVGQIIPRAKVSGSSTLSSDVLTQSFDYNALVGDKTSAVYADLDNAFKEQITVVDLFRINAGEAYDNSQVVRDAAAFEGYATREAFLAAVDPDSDVFVDWVLGGGTLETEVNEDDRTTLSNFTALNTVLYDDLVHPSRLGHALNAYQISTAVPEPGSVLLVALGGLVMLRRRRSA